MIMNKSVLVGLSGGVDSTATALLLQNQGYQVYGLFFDVLGNQLESFSKAEKVAEKLGIEIFYKDVSVPFKQQIMNYFFTEYNLGRTPNPCVQCNKYVKYNILLETADEHNIDYVATGHYGQIVYREEFDEYQVVRAVNIKKDQTYMLYNLDQSALSRMILPLGKMENKDKIREILRDNGFFNWKTKDSQEICFIKNESYIEFISRNYEYNSIPGDFIDINGEKIGRHKGIINYTIGQRRGLNLNLGKPGYVIRINPENNTVCVGDESDLFSNEVISKDNHFSSPRLEKEAFETGSVTAKIRYSSHLEPASIEKLPNGYIKTTFQNPQRAITNGQSIVFYQGECLIGGGIIDF